MRKEASEASCMSQKSEVSSGADIYQLLLEASKKKKREKKQK